MSPRLVFMVAGVVSITGCATIAAGPPQVSVAPLRIDHAEIIREDGVHGTVDQDGTTLAIDAARACDEIERPVAVRTTRTEYTNTSAAVDWLAGGAGLGAAGLGAGVLADVPNVAPTGPALSEVNPVGPAGAVALGVGTVALGVGLLLIPIVDAVRANKETVTLQEVTTNGATTKSDFACSTAKAAGAPVILRVGTSSLDLGTTDADGTLTVDMDERLDASWAPLSTRQLATVTVGDSNVGYVDLAPLLIAREGRAWTAIAPILSTCASPSTSRACDEVTKFLAKYPAGPHAAETQGVLDSAAPLLLARADEESWRARADDVAACGDPKLSSPGEIHAACSGVQAYVDTYPDGAHVAEAKAALKIGRERSAVLESKRQAEEEAEARRQKREEEEARQKESARRALAKSDCIRVIEFQCKRAERRGSIPADICIRRAMEAADQCEVQ